MLILIMFSEKSRVYNVNKNNPIRNNIDLLFGCSMASNCILILMKLISLKSFTSELKLEILEFVGIVA